jgi:hypothetical protein
VLGPGVRCSLALTGWVNVERAYGAHEESGERTSCEVYPTCRHSPAAGKIEGSPSAIPFRIKFLQKTGGIRNLQPTQALPFFSTASKHATHGNTRLSRAGSRDISTLFMRLLHSSLDTRGWGMLPSAYCTTHYPLFTTHGSPQNFYPPASDLRHNPAAQGHTSVPLNYRAHSSLQIGRIQ